MRHLLHTLAPLLLTALVLAACNDENEATPGGSAGSTQGAAGQSQGGAGQQPGTGGQAGSAQAPQIAEAKSALTRETNPQVDDADARALEAGNTAFAGDLYAKLSGSDQFAGKNLFYSPISVSVALGMTYAGARGDTEAAMAKAMRFTLSQDKLHPAMNKLDLALSSRGMGQQGADGKPFRLRLSNSLWAQKDFSFAAPFLDTLATSYGAGVKLVDYVAEAEKARVQINSWTAFETEDRIKDLLPMGSLGSDVRFVIVNAVYFNASWAQQFNPKETADGQFTTASGEAKTVPMMVGQLDSASYAEGDGYKVVSMPYAGGEVAFDLLLPDAGKLAEVEASLDGAKIGEIVGSLKGRDGSLKMPRFEIKGASFSLTKVLSDLGMGVAFTPAADFTGMASAGGLQLFDVVHQAFVKVDEAGTEAAAATAVIGGTTSAPVDPPFQVVADRPFIFWVRDRATGAVLFVGRVSDPS